MPSIVPDSAPALAASRRLHAINRHVAASQCAAPDKTPRDAEEMVEIEQERKSQSEKEKKKES
jgi:hypothetical protein